MLDEEAWDFHISGERPQLLMHQRFRAVELFPRFLHGILNIDDLKMFLNIH